MGRLTNQELEDRVADLEEALHQAIHCIEFMHGCLTDERFRYDYPEHTVRHLQEFRELAPPPKGCVHSVTEPGCASCEDRNRRFAARAERLARRASTRGTSA